MARVLVVDDDETVREVVVSYLRAAGHDVQSRPDARYQGHRLPSHEGLQQRLAVPRLVAQVPREVPLLVQVDCEHTVPTKRRQTRDVRRQRRRVGVGTARRPDACRAAGGVAGGQLQSGWRFEGHLGAGLPRVGVRT